MKRLMWMIVLTLMAFPAQAQDDGGDGGGDFFNMDSLGNFENTGSDFDPIKEIRNLLVRASVTPMDKQQEKALKKLYDKEVKVVAKPYEQRFNVSLKTAMGSVQASSARGRRGGNSGPNSLQAREARRLAELLVDKMIAALRLDQQGTLRTYQSEQLRITKLNMIKSGLAQAGTPLTDTQMAQVESILAHESRLRVLMIVESRGEPHQVKVAQLEGQTNQRLVALMDEKQQVAYAATTARSNTQRTPQRTPQRQAIPRFPPA